MIEKVTGGPSQSSVSTENKHGTYTYVCMCTCAHVCRNANHICFWSWTKKIDYSASWCVVEGSNWMWYSLSQHFVQLVKREKKIKRSLPFILPKCCCCCWFFSPLLSSSYRNTFLLVIILSLCKYGRESFPKPHSSLLVKNITKKNSLHIWHRKES